MNTSEHSKINISENEAREIESLYHNLLSRTKHLSDEADIGALKKSITDLVDFIIEKLSSGNNPLLLYTGKIFDKDYIFAHSLNVCLISIRIGIRLGFDKRRLRLLGFAGLTHANRDTRFPEESLKRMKHDEELYEIIRLADVYDALTHPPAYRHAMTPRDTLSSIIKTNRFFDRRIIKILLEELSLYPKGSWVQLSTMEIGRVNKVNRGRLLRPTVEVFIDWNGRYLKEPKIIDLSKHNLIHVLRPLNVIEGEVKRIRMARLLDRSASSKTLSGARSWGKKLIRKVIRK